MDMLGINTILLACGLLLLFIGIAIYLVSRATSSLTDAKGYIASSFSPISAAIAGQPIKIMGRIVCDEHVLTQMGKRPAVYYASFVNVGPNARGGDKPVKTGGTVFSIQDSSGSIHVDLSNTLQVNRACVIGKELYYGDFTPEGIDMVLGSFQQATGNLIAAKGQDIGLAPGMDVVLYGIPHLGPFGLEFKAGKGLNVLNWKSDEQITLDLKSSLQRVGLGIKTIAAGIGLIITGQLIGFIRL